MVVRPTISSVGTAVAITVPPKWFISIYPVNYPSALFLHLRFMRGPSPKTDLSEDLPPGDLCANQHDPQ
jgi:hypothetical protein